MKHVFERLLELRRDQVPCVLCTVVEASGSAPGKPGARMIVLGDGKVIGTVGGGAIEKRIIEEALDALGREQSRLYR